MTISVARNFLTADEFKSLDSVQELVDSNALTGTIYLKSYYDNWQNTLAGPKGGHFVHRTGATAGAPTVGSPVAPGTIGTGAQAGYYWSQDGFEWQISLDQIIEPYKFGAVGDGVVDDTTAVQNTIDFVVGKGLFEFDLLIGTYLISSTLREATNGGGLVIRGEHRLRCVLKSIGFAGAVMHLGNSNGHGNYRAQLSNFTIDNAVSKAAGSIGLILHENGTSHVHDINIRNFDQAWLCPGCISQTIDGKCEISTSNQGLIFSTPVTGVPSGPDDITTTASPLSLNPNVSVVRDVWFTSISETTLQLTGGLMAIKNCTFQGCGASLSHDVVSVLNGNESAAFGGGPIIQENWFEGGSYRYAIAIRNTRQCRVLRNFIGGSSTNSPANVPKEGGVFVDNASPNTMVKDNNIFQFFVSTPTEGRLANGAVYTQGTLLRQDVFLNYIATTQVRPYYEGCSDPTKMRGHNDLEIVINTVGGTPTIIYDSHNVVSSAIANGVGDYTVTWNFNRETMATIDYPVALSVRTNSAILTYSISAFGGGGTSNERVIIQNGAGAGADPRAFYMRFKHGYQGL